MKKICLCFLVFILLLSMDHESSAEVFLPEAIVLPETEEELLNFISLYDYAYTTNGGYTILLDDGFIVNLFFSNKNSRAYLSIKRSMEEIRALYKCTGTDDKVLRVDQYSIIQVEYDNKTITSYNSDNELCGEAYISEHQYYYKYTAITGSDIPYGLTLYGPDNPDFYYMTLILLSSGNIVPDVWYECFIDEFDKMPYYRIVDIVPNHTISKPLNADEVIYLVSSSRKEEDD